MNRRDFFQVGASLAGLAATAHAHDHREHHHADEAPDAALPGGPQPGAPVVGGSGQFRYRYLPEKLVPDLNGPPVILDKENKVAAVIEVGKLPGHLGFKHSHDAIWLENGDIAVCTWNPGRLGYWRRVEA